MMTCPICYSELKPEHGTMQLHITACHTKDDLVAFVLENVPATDFSNWPLFIRTISRQQFPFLHPEQWRFELDDVAVPLSRAPRFVGHTKPRPYNVADHCLRVAALVPPRWRFPALMHEISEPFMGDMSSPLKQLVPGYKRHQNRIEAALLPKIGISYPLHKCIKDADRILLKAEHRQFMDGDQYVDEHMEGVLEYPYQIDPMSEKHAYEAFVGAFHHYREEWEANGWRQVGQPDAPALVNPSVEIML
jgi:5'-deoxynucleotidase YfbR-like HD superfamily hydrolase